MTIETGTAPGLTASTLVLILAPNCLAGPASSSCNLYGVLHLLYVIAGVLLIILVAVIAFAVHAWRKTKDVELTHQ